MSQDPKATVREFKGAVNMTAGQIASWLETDESKKVGSKEKDGGESVGHESGRRIIEILGKKAADYSDDDLKHMAKVVGYVHRHLAQHPSGEIEDTPWRHSLMNWGHDPAKKSKAQARSKAAD